MKFYSALDDSGREVLCMTQAEAKDINKAFHPVEVPTDKAELRNFIQLIMDQIQAASEMPDPETRVTETVTSLAPPTLGCVEIPVDRSAQELTNIQLFNRLQDDLASLSERAGVMGWSQFAKHNYNMGTASKAVERGLGMLLLAGLHPVDPPEPPQKYQA